MIETLLRHIVTHKMRFSLTGFEEFVLFLFANNLATVFSRKMYDNLYSEKTLMYKFLI